jgi:hypothetical protein
MGFPFQLFEIASDEPNLVYVELLSSGQVLESADETGRYRAPNNQVHDHALSPTESRGFLRDISKEYG